VLEVETAAIRYSKTFTIENDRVVKSLMSDGAGGIADFSTGERIGAGALNLLFGIGSFIQRDTRGGVVTAVLEGLGVVAFVWGAVGFSAELSYEYGGDYNSRSDMTLLDSYYVYPFIGGIVLYTGGAIYGIIRAATYNKPGSVVVMNNPSPLDIGLVSDHRGDVGLRVSYTLRY
jgi:hypothetical protein